MPEPVMRVQRWAEMNAAARAAFLLRGTEKIFDPELAAGVREIIDDVRANGDAAVCRALSRFDRCEVNPERLLLTDDEIDQAADSVAPEVVAAIRVGIANVRAYNERVLADADWRVELSPGLMVGEHHVSCRHLHGSIARSMADDAIPDLAGNRGRGSGQRAVAFAKCSTDGNLAKCASQVNRSAPCACAVA